MVFSELLWDVDWPSLVFFNIHGAQSVQIQDQEAPPSPLKMTHQT